MLTVPREEGGHATQGSTREGQEAEGARGKKTWTRVFLVVSPEGMDKADKLKQFQWALG